MDSSELLADLGEQVESIQERSVVGEREKTQVNATALLTCATALVEISAAVRGENNEEDDDGDE